MKYVGLQQQINSNNTKSILLLLSFPLLVFIAVFAVTAVLTYNEEIGFQLNLATVQFFKTIPFVLIGVGIWFLIAFYSHSAMINLATGAKPLERKENPRIYNLVENLCMSVGMKTPQINIIESDALNAFASGINEKSYAVTLTSGIIDALDDEELEGVIGHELTHIRNHDVRLLIVSIIFVGIFSFVVQVAFRGLLYGSSSSSRNNKDKGGGAIILVILIVSIVAYFLSILFKFALSRRREYLADAGAVELTKRPLALASALRKISGHSKIKTVKSEDLESMFIENVPGDSESSMGFLGGLGGLFASHPPIEKRIQVLEQF
jgi:heat shock protein HtpX